MHRQPLELLVLKCIQFRFHGLTNASSPITWFRFHQLTMNTGSVSLIPNDCESGFHSSFFFRLQDVVGDELSGRWDPCLSMKFTYTSYIPYTQSLKAIKNSLMYLKGRYKERGEHRDFPSTASLAKMTRPKVQSSDPSWAPHVGGRNPSTWVAAC